MAISLALALSTSTAPGSLFARTLTPSNHGPRVSIPVADVISMLAGQQVSPETQQSPEAEHTRTLLCPPPVSLMKQLRLTPPNQQPAIVPSRDATTRACRFREEPNQSLAVAAAAIGSPDDVMGALLRARRTRPIGEADASVEELAEGEVDVGGAGGDGRSGFDVDGKASQGDGGTAGHESCCEASHVELVRG